MTAPTPPTRPPIQKQPGHRTSSEIDPSVLDVSQRDRLETIRQLLEMFRLERLVYLLVTLFSVAVLLVCASVLLVKHTASYPEILGLFGSSGGITYSTGRLLRMWSDAIHILQGDKPTRNES